MKGGHYVVSVLCGRLNDLQASRDGERLAFLVGTGDEDAVVLIVAACDGSAGAKGGEFDDAAPETLVISGAEVLEAGTFDELVVAVREGCFRRVVMESVLRVVGPKFLSVGQQRCGTDGAVGDGLDEGKAHDWNVSKRTIP